MARCRKVPVARFAYPTALPHGGFSGVAGISYENEPNAPGTPHRNPVCVVWLRKMADTGSAREAGVARASRICTPWGSIRRLGQPWHLRPLRRLANGNRVRTAAILGQWIELMWLRASIEIGAVVPSVILHKPATAWPVTSCRRHSTRSAGSNARCFTLQGLSEDDPGRGRENTQYPPRRHYRRQRRRGCAGRCAWGADSAWG